MSLQSIVEPFRKFGSVECMLNRRVAYVLRQFEYNSSFDVEIHRVVVAEPEVTKDSLNRNAAHDTVIAGNTFVRGPFTRMVAIFAFTLVLFGSSLLARARFNSRPVQAAVGTIAWGTPLYTSWSIVDLNSLRSGNSLHNFDVFSQTFAICVLVGKIFANSRAVLLCFRKHSRFSGVTFARFNTFRTRVASSYARLCFSRFVSMCPTLFLCVWCVCFMFCKYCLCVVSVL
jgi:hypothetical protein